MPRITNTSDEWQIVAFKTWRNILNEDAISHDHGVTYRLLSEGTNSPVYTSENAGFRTDIDRLGERRL